MPKRQQATSAGFTLVELAIVLTIIGLLIGGVLKGQELINNARITTTISQVESYQAAHATFRDRYDSIPGDMPRAIGRLPGCTTASFCYNGDGNSILGIVSTNYSRNDQSGLTTMPSVETSMYWKHLVLADLISGVDGTSITTSPTWGKTHPSAKIGGGFHVIAANETGDNQASGHYYLLRKPATGDPHVTDHGYGVLTPGQASQIDRKKDDGKARTGYIRSDDGAAWCSNATTGDYNETSSLSDCLTIFYMQ